jgi:hypothetical protein
MPDLSERDTAAHIHPELRDTFSTWRDLRAFVESHATSPGFHTERALRQLLSVDLAHRLARSADYGWVVRGSLALPARPPPGIALPEHVLASGQGTEIDPFYVMARPLNDIDLCARSIPDAPAVQEPTAPVAHADRLAAVIGDVVDTGPSPETDRGVGLGGLVHYGTDDLRTLLDGRAVATVIAQPVDPRRVAELTPVDDSVAIQVDLSPPGAAAFEGQPERAHRSTLALDIPGFDEHRPDLYPTANQLSDKLCTISAPYGTAEPPPTWHRYKDLPDVQYLIDTCPIDAGQLRRAVEVNPKLAQFGRRELPSPFQPYGLRPGQGGVAVSWREGYERKRAESPALAGYRDFDDAVAWVGGFVDEWSAGDDDRIWLPAHGWLPREQAMLVAGQDRVRQLKQHLTAASEAHDADLRRRAADAASRQAHDDARSRGRDGPTLSH